MDLTLNTNPQNTFDYMDSTASANKKFAYNLHLKPYIHVSWYQSSNSLSDMKERISSLSSSPQGLTNLH